MWKKIWFASLAVALLLVFLGFSGRILVVDRPRPADVIVVLAGETELRPERGLELLRESYASRMILDVPTNAKIFQWTELELAQQYIQQRPEGSRISVCPIGGLSTKGEVPDVSRCLHGSGVRSVLLVTSDYHTRRAFDIFSKLLPDYRYEIAAVSDPRDFGTPWWRHREWAKTAFNEWLKLVWWELVDRWRG
jgi:hypothetical protein